MKVDYNNRRLIKSFYNASQLVYTKTIHDLPEDVFQELVLISLPGTKIGYTTAEPYGSFINRASEYYGDIDAQQLYVKSTNLDELGKNVAKELQKTVKRIIKTKDHFFSEAKAGEDERYVFDYGKLENNRYELSKEMHSIPKELYNQGLLSDIEMKVIEKVLHKSNRDGKDYDIIFNLFRDHFVLRWSAAEISKGFKMVHGQKILLNKAVLDHTALKIDMLVILNNKFLEITNYIAIGLSREGKFSAISNEVIDEIVSRREGKVLGYYTPINVNLEEIRKVAKTLPPDIENLYYSDFYYSPFKITKRAFALLKYLYKHPEDLEEQRYREIGFNRSDVENLIFKYTNVLKSTIGILYSIRSEIEAMKLMLERNTGVPIGRLNNRLDSLTTNLSNVLELDGEQLEMFIGMFDECIKAKNKTTKIDKLSDLSKASKFIIDYWTIRYYNAEQINPPPYPLVPRHFRYDKNLRRKAQDHPENPLKVALAKASGKKGGFIGSLAKSLFTKIANYYRRNYCDGKARPLYPGEYHYGCHNFTGQLGPLCT